MKEKLIAVIGVPGLIVWWFITVILTFAPLYVLDFPSIVDLLIIAAVLFLPFVGDIVQLVLWIWSFVIALKGPFDVVAIIYFIAAAVYVLTTLLPFVSSLLEFVISLFKSELTNHRDKRRESGILRFIFSKTKKQKEQDVLLINMQNSLDKKPMFHYKMMEPFNLISLSAILADGGRTAFGRCRFLCENENYRFYGFTPILSRFLSREYILRQSKLDIDETLFFGEARELSCVFCNHLFLVDKDLLENNLLCVDIETGKTEKYEWFSAVEGYRGHFMSHDYVNRIYVDGDAMILDVGHLNCDFYNRDDSFNGETAYFLKVKLEQEFFCAEKIERAGT